MSLYNKIMGNRENKNTPETGIDWKPLTEINQLDEIIDESSTTPVVIFKHSTTCGISRMALRNFERDYQVPGSAATLYLVDLLQFRDLSRTVAERFDVRHESPQLLLIKDGKSVYDVSHGDIDAVSLEHKITDNPL